MWCITLLDLWILKNPCIPFQLSVIHLRSSPTITHLTKQALLRSTQNRLGIIHVLLKFPFCSSSQQLSHLIVSVCLSLAILLEEILFWAGCDYTLST